MMRDLTGRCGHCALAMGMAACAWGWACMALGDMPFPGDPVPLAQVGGKAGAYRVTMTARSPLSTPKEIIKRMHLKGVEEADYEWDKEVYDLYVPKEAGEGGKYGLMVGAVFKDFGAPPGDWGEELEKHHVIWICAEQVGNGKPGIKRVGTMLDAVHNVKRAYAVQDWRTYASMGASEGPVGMVALHYSDVFDGGALYTVGWVWHAKVKNARGATWIVKEGVTAPDPERMGQAKAHGRYFFVMRTEDASRENFDCLDFYNKGYKAFGFNANLIQVTHEQMGHYGAYDPTIFEQGIAFLDAGLAKQAAKVVTAADKAAGTAASPAATPPTASETAAKPVAGADNDAAQKAEKELNMANNYLALKKYDLARPKLKKIVETYPGTEAAARAAKLLKEIEGM